MRIRNLGLAAGAVAIVATVAAVVTLLALRGPWSLESMAEAPPRSLESTASALPAFDTTSPSGTLTAGQPRPRAVTPLRAFDGASAMAHVRALEAFGVRAGGSPAEAQAAAYIRGQLVALGLDARIEEFPLSNGGTSRNVIARVKGTSDTVVVLGAHMDSKPPSPGANDNGSGCGALLELATVLAEQPVVPTVEFVFFGSEEIIGGDSDAHHFGSRYRVAQMSAAERARTAGMMSVDMIGYGSAFHSRTMARGPMTLSDMLVASANGAGVGMSYLKDTSKTGLSDHEAYELAGMPVSCVTWRQDPVYHTTGDVASHLSSARVGTTGAVVLGFLRGLDAADLATLTAR